MPARIIRPPMVGVPVFFRWDFNSSRSVCLAFIFLRSGITTGPNREVMAKAIRTGIITFCVIFSAPLRFYDVFAHRILALLNADFIGGEYNSFFIIKPFILLCKGDLQ